MTTVNSETKSTQTASLPVEFTFEDHALRTIIKDDQPWFIATDVCKVLDIKDTSQAIDRLDDDEKGCVSDTDPWRTTEFEDRERHPACSP